MNRLQGRVAVITGGATGIGGAGASLFAKEGCKVVIACRNEEAGRKKVEEIKAEGGEAAFFKTDISEVEQIRALIDFTIKQYGKLNILWNNAGIPGPKGINGITVEQWDYTMNVNLRSNFFAAQAAYPYLNAAADADGVTSSILLTASTGGLVASTVSPLYGTSKGGQVNLTRSLAAALAPRIRVNCICPSTTDTPMLPSFGFDHPEEQSAEAIENYKRSRMASNLLGRMQSPDEVAALALFLVSGENQFMTGAIIPTDAGLTCR